VQETKRQCSVCDLFCHLLLMALIILAALTLAGYPVCCLIGLCSSECEFAKADEAREDALIAEEEAAHQEVKKEECRRDRETMTRLASEIVKASEGMISRIVGGIQRQQRAVVRPVIQRVTKVIAIVPPAAARNAALARLTRPCLREQVEALRRHARARAAMRRIPRLPVKESSSFSSSVSFSSSSSESAGFAPLKAAPFKPVVPTMSNKCFTAVVAPDSSGCV